MKNLGREALFDLMMLSVVAGSADAAGFLGLGHVFTSNMTGNLVLLGIAIGEHQWSQALKTLIVILTFAFGVMLGSRLVSNLPDLAWKKVLVRILTFEAGLIFAFAVLWANDALRDLPPHFYSLILFLTVAMGLQSAAMSRLMIAGVSNTAITGTLTSLCVGIENLFRNGASRNPGQKRIVEQALVIVLYACGAMCTCLLLHFARWAIGFVPATIAVVILGERLIQTGKAARRKGT
jgi:uncharacterized membrane protein YoaK (UPF0700 family)